MDTGWLKLDMRSLILETIKKKKHTARSLCKVMRIKGGKAKALFFSTLKELILEKKIVLDKDGYFIIQDEKKESNARANVIYISKEGYGMVFRFEDNSKEKYIIYSEDLNGALDGDTVEIESDNRQISGGYKKARVVKIIKRSSKAVFEFDGSKLIAHGVYGNIKVVCPREQLKKLVNGSLVLVTLETTAYMKKNEKLVYRGNIDRIIGHKDDPDAEIEIIGAKRGFYKDFSDEAIRQANSLNSFVTEDDIKGRVDLRDEKVFTIDCSHTKDRDDAISIDVDEFGNYILKVHIADVSHYIKKDSPLDKEAMERGTSLYMVDSVIPMLPHQLSNGICSLNENVDRLTKTVEMKINDNGEVIGEKIYYSVINSKKAMTYEDVNQILENAGTVQGYGDFTEEILILTLLTSKQEKLRGQRGNINFNLPDLAVIRDGENVVFDEMYAKGAEKIIENCMILANTTIARHYIKMGLPMISRVHDEPNLDGLVTKLKFLMGEGLCGRDALYLIKKIENRKLNSYDLESFLNRYRNTEIEEIVATDVLSCMSKAIYTEQCRGHYGLGLDHYTHFTSPIRRYPDLVVHRLIDLFESANMDLDEVDEMDNLLPDICAHSSFMEREADKAEKESLDLKMAEYCLEHVGCEYMGRIISFKPYGVDIKLNNNIRGVAKKGDIKSFNKIKLGQMVYVLIKEVSTAHRAIFFELVDRDNKHKVLEKV